jgi:hypothetical protein
MKLITNRTAKDQSKTYTIPHNISLDILTQLRRLGRTDSAALQESVFLDHDGVFVSPNISKELTKLGVDCGQLEHFIANVREKK